MKSSTSKNTQNSLEIYKLKIFQRELQLPLAKKLIIFVGLVRHFCWLLQYFCRRTSTFFSVSRRSISRWRSDVPLYNFQILLFKMSKRVHTTASSRLKQDYLRIQKDPVPYVTAAPLPTNILEWYEIYVSLCLLEN